MIDPKALAALQEAASLIEAEIPVPTPEETRKAENAARLAEQARLRRPTPEESGRAWKAKHRADVRRRKRSLTLETLGQAEALLARGVPRPDPTVPKDARAFSGVDRRLLLRLGRTAREHALAWVRETLAEGGWHAVEHALPQEFLDDPAPLCGVERELLSEPHEYLPPPEEPGDETRAEGYLMPGMRREEER